MPTPWPPPSFRAADRLDPGQTWPQGGLRIVGGLVLAALVSATTAIWWFGFDEDAAPIGPRADAIVAHWEAYSTAWAGGRDDGIAFIVEHNMYAAGPVACGVAYPVGHSEALRADPSTIVRSDEWNEPWADRLAHEADEIYELTVLPDDHDPLVAHIAFVDGSPRHYFGCHPDWIGGWEASANDGVAHSMWVTYSSEQDRFHAMSIESSAPGGPCAGGPSVSRGSVGSTRPDSLVIEWQAWCGTIAVAADSEIVERTRSDGTTELLDRASGATFRLRGQRFAVGYVYDLGSDTLSDETGSSRVRSRRSFEFRTDSG